MDFFYNLADHAGLIVLGAFALITGIQLFYYWYFFSRIAFYKKQPPAFVFPPVSLVVCARNEYLNLQENLPFLLEQDYPDFEVVVVDDRSDDDSGYLLQDLSALHPNLKIVTLNSNLNFFKGKKFPLSMGIKSAKNELLLLTDADCRPATKQWIKSIVRHYSGSPDIVLGYGAYEKTPGFLNKLIRFDTMIVALQYLGMALAGKPYMGVGRNLSYNRKLFFQAKGFTSHYKIMSGDDDIFINQVATSSNCAVEISPDSHTISIAKKDFSSWFKQKSRHMTTGSHYKKNHKVILGIFAISQILFYPLFVALLFFSYPKYLLPAALAIFIIRTMCLMIIVKYASMRLNETKLFLYSPLLDGAMTFLNLMFSFSALFVRRSKWK